jgi:hypothetical protein
MTPPKKETQLPDAAAQEARPEVDRHLPPEVKEDGLWCRDTGRGLTPSASPWNSSGHFTATSPPSISPAAAKARSQPAPRAAKPAPKNTLTCAGAARGRPRTLAPMEAGAAPRQPIRLSSSGCRSAGSYHPTTRFDLLLPRILAGHTIDRMELAPMGYGGFCEGCPDCTYPKCAFSP